jgi:hypothetical protein
MQAIKKTNIITDTFKWLFDFEDWRMLFRSIPGIVTMMSVITVVVMNLMAAKVVIMTPYIGVTGGLFLSWIPFLIGDVVVKTYGAKAATKLNILGLIVNLICIGIFQLVTFIHIGIDQESYSAFNSTFTQTWQIFVASSIAFILSGVINNFTNAGIGTFFKKNPDGKIAYMCRSYISTALGQFFDNLIFAGLAFLVFFKLSVGSSFGYTIVSVLGTAVLGAILELLMQVVFSPIGYKMCKKWRNESVGADYLEYCKQHEVYKEIGRLVEE